MSKSNEGAQAAAAPTQHPVEAFQQRAATALIKATQGRQDRSSMRSTLAGAGISADVKPGNAEVMVATVKLSEDFGLPRGTNRGMFTAAALAEYDAKALRNAQTDVWRSIRELTVYGTIQGDQALAILDELGYGESARPAAQTHVTAEVANGRINDGYDKIDTVLKGEHSKESVLALLEAKVPTPRAATLITQAFGDLVVGPVPAKVRNLRVLVDTSWPDEAKAFPQA